jgi:hypothetical protein
MSYVRLVVRDAKRDLSGDCHVVIDLAARLVAYESSYSSPSMRGQVHYHGGRCAT